MKTALGTSLMLAAIIATSHAQELATPAASNNAPGNSVSPGASASGNDLIPGLQFSNVPVSTAIEQLARTAGVNYLMDPRLTQKWADSGEPTITLKLQNASAKTVLQQLLNTHKMALVEDPASNLAFILSSTQVDHFEFAALPAAAANPEVIPLIQFSAVPLTTAIEHLARQADLNYIIAPNVLRLWDPEPRLNLHLEHVSAGNLLRRLLEIHGLVLREDAATRVAQITCIGQSVNPVDFSLLGINPNGSVVNTNDILPLISFQDVPLDTGLEHLIGSSALPAELPLRLTDPDDPGDQVPFVSIRWKNITPRQALAALCENYDLIITQTETGKLKITPDVAKKHHHLQLK